MQRSKLISIIILIFVALWFAGGYIRKSFSTHEDASQSAAPLARVKVTTSHAKLHPVCLTLRGVTKADVKVTLRAETDGPVMEILANKGSTVKKGDSILKLSPKDRLAKLEEAKATVTSKEIEYHAAQKLFEKDFTPKTALAKAKSNFQVAKAHLKEIEIDLKNTDIKAPFSGIIDSQSVELGQFVKLGDELVTLVDLDPIKSVIPVSEEKINLLKLGEKTKIKSINGSSFEGEVTYISRVADPATRTYQIELSAQNPHHAIPDGMTIEALIPLGKAKAHFITPSILSLDESGKIGIKIADEKKMAHFVPVEIVDTDTNGVWVMGLPDTSQIIVTGQAFIKDGELLELVEGVDSK
ncbi:Multidrug efflux pump subunit AcrA [Candidatus Bealeia paramacronuclearis]|uniref:Multidrug efflux pump subunit AcrA n=1 Tax=Candidatus Bealeia paramacronuclearis TaxID=1921001 RepID=A0ABZ2C2Q5_9PROT|nr:Multidrug efflux pump subunit AcrA [Candidatus Bealeia paramacronuclearis]